MLIWPLPSSSAFSLILPHLTAPQHCYPTHGILTTCSAEVKPNQTVVPKFASFSLYCNVPNIHHALWPQFPGEGPPPSSPRLHFNITSLRHLHWSPSALRLELMPSLYASFIALLYLNHSPKIYSCNFLCVFGALSFDCKLISVSSP